MKGTEKRDLGEMKGAPPLWTGVRGVQAGRGLQLPAGPALAADPSAPTLPVQLDPRRSPEMYYRCLFTGLRAPVFRHFRRGGQARSSREAADSFEDGRGGRQRVAGTAKPQLFARFSRGGLWGARPGASQHPRLGDCAARSARRATMFEDEPHADGAAVVAAAGEALQALCLELNLDEGSAAEALDDFTAIRGNYSLEVSGDRWGCRTAPRRAPPRPQPTFGGGGRLPHREGWARAARSCKGGLGLLPSCCWCRCCGCSFLRRETEA